MTTWGVTLVAVDQAASVWADGLWPWGATGQACATGRGDTVGQAILESREAEQACKDLPRRLKDLARQSMASVCEPIIFNRFEVDLGVGSTGYRDLRAAERTLLIDCLSAVEPMRLRAYWDSLGGPGVGKVQRLAALEVLAVHGTAQDVQSLSDWAGGYGSPDRVPRILRATFEEALRAVIQRDPRAIRKAGQVFRDMPLALTPALVAAIASTNHSEGLVTLAGMLGKEKEVDPLILRELTILGAELPHPLNEQAQQHVARTLLAASPVVRLQAIAACRSMECSPAVPDLIELLESKSSNESKQAYLALKTITGQLLSQDGREWKGWMQESTNWWETQAPELIYQVRGGTPALASRAIMELSRHRMYRHLLVGPVAAGLEHGQDSIVRVACAALGYMDSPLGVAPLLKKLSPSHSQSVRQAAVQALHQITGQNHGDDPAAWQQAGW